MKNNKMHKLALVKQDVFPDLYICGKHLDDIQVLLSTSMRVGPIGLWEDFDVDFLIVKECPDRECRVWERDCDPKYREKLRDLKNISVNQIEGQEFLRPGSSFTAADYSQSVDDIDWGVYDIVLSINIAVPTRIVMKYSKVLWVHMSGESYKFIDKAYFGYDLAIKQMTDANINFYKRTLSFPYTYVSADTLYRIATEISDIVIHEKKGIYAEVNCTTERPVERVPQLEPVAEATNEPIIVHKQELIKNLESMINAKYFVKLGGRGTRGNGVVESISLGTPVLMNPFEIEYRQILPKEAWVFSAEDIISKINYYNANEQAYHDLIKKEKELVQQFCHDYPLNGLLEFMRRKKEKPVPNKNIYFSEFLDKVKYKLNEH